MACSPPVRAPGLGSRAAPARRARLLAGAAAAALCAACLAAPGAAAAPPAALAPSYLHALYGLPRTGAPHQTIGVVSAYDDPGIEADLADYDRRFHLPACDRANGCLRVLNQSGQPAPLPSPDPSGEWLSESSIGAEVAHGVCQSCSIVLVEAAIPTKYDLASAVNAAALAGAGVIVTAFNLSSDAGDTAYDSDFVHPRSVVVAAAGDVGYDGQVTFPSDLPGVVAVGGTRLGAGGGAYPGERAWSETTSGCAPALAGAWQRSLAASVGCGSLRAVADIAAVASPGALVHIQDAAAPCGPAWCGVEGTSVSAPIIAGAIALAGSAGSGELPMLYAHARSEHGVLHDIARGSVSGCAGEPICAVHRGYDGPTGLGTPDGLGAFLASGGALSPARPRLSLASSHRRLSANRVWRLAVRLSNSNPFAVAGSLAIWATLRVGGRARAVMLAAGGLSVASLGSATRTLTIAPRYRAALARLRSLRVRLRARVRGPAGRAVTVAWRRVLRVF
jgi:hypothetical protein